MHTRHSSIFLILIFIFVSSCNKAQNHDGKANRLINETSPYLLQHAYNPVDWYAWGEEAFAKAKKEDKPLIVSIGYSSCHWCHVMEKESFEDDSVAALMNKYFVCIKVDREERPDVDQIYIEAAQMMTGSAGWPLNSIVLPDGKPFFAGTYFPKAQWIELLNKVHELWEKDRKRIELQADQITSGIKQNSLFTALDSRDIDEKMMEPVSKTWLKMFDKKEGGYKRVPKFPMPSNIETLFNLYKLNNNQEALEIAKLTLDKMARGGIYDQVGGGFARYSTDGYWKVPHFEKMLYDNGQLLSLYSKGYQVTKNLFYRQVVDETITFMERELLSDYGGFYSSLDADSDGEEGLFYVWKKPELDEALGESSNIINDYYQVENSGNWEHGKNILLAVEDEKEISDKYNITLDSLQIIVCKAKNVLLKKRSFRIRPGLDDKILTSWNSLAIIGLTDAYRAFQDERYLLLALNTGNFIAENMINDDFRLNRNFKEGKSSINAFLDDYAFTISAFINLYQVTFDENWLQKARSLSGFVLEHFSDLDSDYFFYTSDLDPALITRKMENIDNVIPSANSEMALNLFLLGNYFYDNDYLKKSDSMLKGMLGYIDEHVSSFVSWFQLYTLKTHDFYEVAIVGNDYEKLKSEFEIKFLPNTIIMGGRDEGSLELLKNKLIPEETRMYVCKEKMCKLPVASVNDALLQMDP